MVRGLSQTYGLQSKRSGQADIQKHLTWGLFHAHLIHFYCYDIILRNCGTASSNLWSSVLFWWLWYCFLNLQYSVASAPLSKKWKYSTYDFAFLTDNLAEDCSDDCFGKVIVYASKIPLLVSFVYWIFFVVCVADRFAVTQTGRWRRKQWWSARQCGHSGGRWIIQYQQQVQVRQHQGYVEEGLQEPQERSIC